MNYRFLYLIVCLLCNTLFSQKLNLVSNKVIWAEGKHNAFTSLIINNSVFYCAFREGSSHKSYDGSIRVIYSKDADKWTSMSIFKIKGEDLRDPKLVVVNEKLYLNFVSRTKDQHFSYTYFYNDNLSSWELMEKSKGTWRWGITVKDDKLYSTAYSGIDKGGSIYYLDSSDRKKKWKKINENIFPNKDSKPNEASILFNSNNDKIMMLRQDGGNKSTLLGIQEDKTNYWRWSDLGVRLGSPETFLLSEDMILVCVRSYFPKVETIIGIVNLKEKEFSKKLTLPSGGDTGYGSIIQYNNRFYVTYNSSKNINRKTSVYIAELILENE